MRNVEIKAKVRNLTAIIEKAKKLSDINCEVIKQHDTFFKVPQGRLKLRKYEVRKQILIKYVKMPSEYKRINVECFVFYGVVFVIYNRCLCTYNIEGFRT